MYQSLFHNPSSGHKGMTWVAPAHIWKSYLNGTSWLSICSRLVGGEQAGLKEVTAGASAAAEDPSSVGKASEREKTSTDIVQVFQS